MREVALHDPNRKPSSWTELIRPGQYVAFVSDLETGAEMNGAGLYLAPGMIRTCLIFESLSEASGYCLQKIEAMPNLRYDVFDDHGRVNPPVATFVNKGYEHRLDSPVKAARMMRWGLVAIAASLPLFWFTWIRRGEAWIAAFFGVQFVLLGLRLLHWGYSMREELRYRKAQSDLRMQQNANTEARRS
jgi:hypothetical protein